MKIRNIGIFIMKTVFNKLKRPMGKSQGIHNAELFFPDWEYEKYSTQIYIKCYALTIGTHTDTPHKYIYIYVCVTIYNNLLVDNSKMSLNSVSIFLMYLWENSWNFQFSLLDVVNFCKNMENFHFVWCLLPWAGYNTALLAF